MKTKINALSEPVKILRRLQQFGYKSAILAGGAIRDDYTGKEITDYDIFLWDPRHSKEFCDVNSTSSTSPQIDLESINFEMERTTEFIGLLQTLELNQLYEFGGYGGIITCDGDKISEPGFGVKLTSIWEAQIEYSTYQLIYTQISPLEYLEKHFDIGLCKCYCDGQKIRYTPDFMKDVRNNTFTIVAQDMTQEQFDYVCDHHIEKLKVKYPNFTIRIAPHNQSLWQNYCDRH